ncbi:MAG: hypothetical protein WED05_05640 [Candidatus Atabeyarchaeum deiterrae]
MKKDNSDATVFTNAIGEFLAWLSVLRIALGTQAFRGWLKEYHGIEDEHELLAGYRFLVDTCVRCLIRSVTMGTGLDLTEDYTFFRARFTGIPLNDIPNTCEKTIFIKRIWKAARGIRESEEWQQFETSTKHLLAFLDSISQVVMPHVISAVENVTESQALKVSTIAYTLIDLNDTKRGFPKGQLAATVLNPVTEEQFLKSAYAGYVYALQYLWYRLVGKEQYGKSCLVDLHKLDPSLTSSGKKSVQRREERHPERKSWYVFDGYFDRINNEISLPLENQLAVRGADDNILVLSESFDKKEFGELLKPKGLTDPDYMHKTDKASVMKQLNYYLLWYEVNVLDAQELTVFNGVPAFVPLVMGVVEQRKLEHMIEKVQIRVFKHPVGEKGRKEYDYSYCILIEAVSSLGISDYSGWLVFFDCACDYSGFGITSYRKAKSLLNSYEKRNLIEVREIEVDNEIFREYLGKRSVSSVFETVVYEETEINIPDRIAEMDQLRRLNLLELKARTEDTLGNLKGKFFEYLFFDWLVEEKGSMYASVRCDTQEEGEQIDVLAEKIDGKTVDFYECKVKLHVGEIEKTIKQTANKINALQKSREDKTIAPYLVVFSDISDANRLMFLEKGIRVVSPFARAIAEWRKLSAESRKIIHQLLA